MELMDWGTLEELLKRAGSIPEPQLGKIAVQLLDGLAYIHKEFHVLHRFDESFLLLHVSQRCFFPFSLGTSNLQICSSIPLGT